MEILKDEEKCLPMIHLPFLIEKKARLTKPTTRGEQEGREENALEYEDFGSEKDEAK